MKNIFLLVVTVDAEGLLLVGELEQRLLLRLRAVDAGLRVRAAPRHGRARRAQSAQTLADHTLGEKMEIYVSNRQGNIQMEQGSGESNIIIL